MTFKQKIHSYYLEVVNHKIARLHLLLQELRESASGETKSTAGDKHETGLAMIQIEQANVQGQLKEINDQKTLLMTINPSITSNIVSTGSVILTNRGYLFISAALGKATVDGKSVIALSQHSPLGKLLMGLSKGERITMKEIEYLIELVE